MTPAACARAEPARDASGVAHSHGTPQTAGALGVVGYIETASDTQYIFQLVGFIE